MKSSSFIKQFGSMFGALVRLLTVLKSVESSAYDIKVNGGVCVCLCARARERAYV